MAITFTCRARLASTSNATSYATANTYTPGANHLLVAFVVVSGSQTDPPGGCTGHGLTFSQKAVINLSTTHRLMAYVAKSGASPTSAAVTVGTWGSNQTGCIIFEYELTGVDLSGTALAAIIQAPTNSGTSATGTVTLSAAAKSTNRPMSFWCHLLNEATTPRTNWTEDTTPQASDGNYNTPPTGGEAQHRDDAFETTASATFTSSLWAGIALEVSAFQNTRGQISWAELAIPFVNTRGRVSWSELEAPTANTRGRVSWAELGIPSVNTRGRLSWAELETPFVPTRGRISWAELELPFVLTRGRVSWAELEAPFSPTRGRLSWSELEVPDVPTGSPTRGQVSWAELDIPFVATRGRISWSELELPFGPTRGRVSWSELELPIAPTRGRVSWAEWEIPVVITRGRISWAKLQFPSVGQDITKTPGFYARIDPTNTLGMWVQIVPADEPGLYMKVDPLGNEGIWVRISTTGNGVRVIML